MPIDSTHPLIDQMSSSNKCYTALPVKEDLKNAPTITKIQKSSSSTQHYKSMYGTVAVCILVLLGFIFLDDEFSHNDKNKDTSHHWKDTVMKLKKQGLVKEEADVIPPTLLPGGGRDWKLDVDNGIISPKHNDNLVLGTLPNMPLVLTNKGQSNQIIFPTDKLKALKEGKSVSLPGLGLQYPNEDLKELDEWYYTEVGAEKDLSISLEYLDDNFIACRDKDGREMVLDISFWVQTKGNTVNFVSANANAANKPTKWWSKWFAPKTFEYGGGRDWVINLEDGTISSKHAPYLVLGYGPKRLILIENKDAAAAKFENLDKLANGERVQLTFTDGNAVEKLQSEEKYAGPWRYIESNIVPSNNGVFVKYVDNNYIATAEEGVPDEKALVLDVSFWSMTNDNTVNFVGGWTWEK
jgi:hypothetical protein